MGLIFAVKKFHQYIYGRKFSLVTDHKPLLAILGSKKGIPPLAAARMQRWSFLLSAYTYDIQFKPTTLHCNADGMSRLPLQQTSTEETPEVTLFNIGQIAMLPVTAQQLQKATMADTTLCKVFRYIKLGWPSQLPEDIPKLYWTHRNELTVEGECIMFGIRVVVPPKLQKMVLQELHSTHPGIQRMKSIGRSHVWWPGIDQNMVKACTTCQQVKQAPAVAPLHPWIWPSRPWQRVHVDFAGPFLGSTYLIAVDAHSKWPEVQEMKSTMAAKTIEVLRHLFARFGLPEQLVSDNGPQFVAEEFAEFLKQNGVKHVKCAPYHPSSNGLAERFVRTFKEAMKAGARDGLPLAHRLENFLLMYRASPHATTGVAPSSLFLGRDIRTRMHLLSPQRESRVVQKQANQKASYDRLSQTREFHVGQEVTVRNLRPGSKYVPGVIVERLGPLSYLVSGVTWRRHVDHIKPLAPSDKPPYSTVDLDLQTDDQDFIPTSTNPDTDNQVPTAADMPAVEADPPPVRTYPSRDRNHPSWYGQVVTH